MTTKTDEAYQVVMDVEDNLAPMIVRFTKKHYDNGDHDQVKRIQRRLASIITSCHPMPKEKGND